MHRVVRNALVGCLTFWLFIQSGLLHADPQHSPQWTQVEKLFLADSGRQSAYPHEYIPVIETRNQYDLGKLSALRFIEWVQDNPRGVIALTSGNTPEYFIKFLSHYKKNWQKPEVQSELKRYGINQKEFPKTQNLKFVQIEEYFPMSERHYKKVSNYITRHYKSLLELKDENILKMNFNEQGILAEKGAKVLFMNGKVDLSIMDREPSSQLEVWQKQAIKETQQFCIDYENKIREWGGIGFYIGCISYSGHLGFNAAGTPYDGKTHIVKLDYRTAAHAAKDLGGIEYARDKIVVTIGLGTLTINPNVVLIVLASGEAKAESIQTAIENQIDIKYPTSILQTNPHSRFYITAGAAKNLTDRRTEDVKIASKRGWNQQLLEEVIVEIAQAENKEILLLTNEDLEKHSRGKLLLRNPPKPLVSLLADVRNRIIGKIEAGVSIAGTKSNRILHTAPHHDDIVLAYYPLMDNLTRKSNNYFAYITSGFNSVSDAHILNLLNRVSDAWINKEEDAIFKKSYENIIKKFRHYFVKESVENLNNIETVLFLKHLSYIYDIKTTGQLKQTIRWLKDEYFPSKSVGDLDFASIKTLKGMMRESEADRLWSLKNIPLHNITHFRSNFYSGREFGKTPRFTADVLPFINLYNDFSPDIITVADDPQSSPPVTHYKVLQVVAQALRANESRTNDNLEIWGYRNIWFIYAVPEANLYVPVTEKMIEAQKKAFLTCFSTQRSASFPSPFFDGDFSTLTGSIQQNHLKTVKQLIGEDYFTNNPNPDIKNAAGFVFLNKMTVNQFLERAEDLGLAIELEESFQS